jgi:hypothetical protein
MVSNELVIDRVVETHSTFWILATVWYSYRFSRVLKADSSAAANIWLSSTMLLLAKELSIAPMIQQNRCDNLVFGAFVLLVNYPIALHIRWWQKYALQLHESKNATKTSWNISGTVIQTGTMRPSTGWVAFAERLSINQWFYVGVWAFFTFISLFVAAFSVVPHAESGCFVDSPECFLDLGVDLSITALVFSLLSGCIVVALFTRLPTIDRLVVVEISVTSTAQGVFFGASIGQYHAAYETCSTDAMESARLLICLYALFSVFHLVWPIVFVDSSRIWDYILSLFYKVFYGRSILSQEDDDDEDDPEDTKVAEESRVQSFVQVMSNMVMSDDFPLLSSAQATPTSEDYIPRGIIELRHLRRLLIKYRLARLLLIYAHILDFAADCKGMSTQKRQERTDAIFKDLETTLSQYPSFPLQIPPVVGIKTRTYIEQKWENPLITVQGFLEAVFRLVRRIEDDQHGDLATETITPA